MMNSMRYFLSVVFLFALFSGVTAQRSLDFDKLTMDDGFSSNRANAIIQDKKGYMWIGTWNGLNRYDGYVCKEYIPDFRDSLTLSNREVVALLEDSNENIWIGTSSGLNRMDPKTGEIKTFEFHYRILALLEDSEGYIWIGTWNGGLYRLSPDDGKMVYYLGNDIINDILEDSRGILWVATYNGLVRLDRSTGKLQRINDTSNSISHTSITQIEESADGTLWLGTWGGGLNKLKIDPSDGSYHFTHYTAQNRPGGLNSNVVYKLLYDRLGNLWLGTWDYGLKLLEPTEQEKSPDEAYFQSFQHDINNPGSLSGNNLSALFVDRSGMLWVGADKINRTSIINTGIQRFNTTSFENGEFSYRTVRSFAEQDGKLWVGTINNLKLFEKEKEHYIHIKDIGNPSYIYNGYSFTSSSVLSIATCKQGLLVGTDDAGLLLYPDETALNSKNPKFRYFNTMTSPALPGNKINCVVVSKKYPDVIWIGTMQRGFGKLTLTDTEATTQLIWAGNSSSSLSDNNIRTVFEDKDGLVWIGTQNGLNCYDPKTNEIRKFFHSYNDTGSINDNVINCIFEDRTGTLWIGTNSGLNKKLMSFSDNGELQISFRGYPNLDRVGNSIITNILEDDTGKLWIKLYRGIVSFNPQSERIIKDYLTKEYMEIAIERNASIKTSDGNIFLGGDKGFMYFNPDSLFQHPINPEVVITNFLVFNEPYDKIVKQKDGDSEHLAIPYVHNIELTHKDKVFTIEFSAMDYKNPKRNVYAYFLEGYDKMWNEVGTRNYATYTNIRPGEYTFKVKGMNSDGTWSEEPATFQIRIRPPFYMTYWAYILYALALIAILYFFKEYSIIQVREKSRIMLERIQNEKDHRLNELKTLFFTDITHEFRTPLTLIQGPAEELMHLPDVNSYAKKQAELILRNTTKLLRLVNQLMDFRKLERGKMRIIRQDSDIVQLMDEINESFKPMADSREIQLNFSYGQPNIQAYVDIEKIEKIMFNLISNAFKYSDEGGKIDVRIGLENVEKLGEALVIEVEDTGIGIAEEDLQRIFERFFQTHQKRTHSTGGIGLYLSKMFIEQHGGNIVCESSLGIGSIFRVEIPANAKDSYPELEEGETETMDEMPDREVVPVSPIDLEVNLNKNENTSSTRYKVLIVEDDNDLNDFIVTGLSADFEVTGVFNGNQGFEKAKEMDPDIIITDIMMPEMNGFEMCEALRKDIATSHIPVIFLTAKTMREYEIKGLNLGAVDYIHKPFSLVALKLKVNNFLANRKQIHNRIRTEQLLEPETIELSSLDEQLLKDAVAAVNKFLDDPTFDVEKFSMEIGVSANQAYRKIKALTGQTAKEFIRNQRLKTAASLLLQKKRSIAEIIYMVGFSSPSYFTRCFKEYYNCTPKEYIARGGKVDDIASND